MKSHQYQRDACKTKFNSNTGRLCECGELFCLSGHNPCRYIVSKEL